jgi:glycosyltransferase involved in cell wall biosynthesis
MKKIDIMLPYWGEYSLLKKTIESVMAQTSKNWTLTIIDDHYPSTEAQDFCKKINDKRVKYYRHKKNIGVTNNFNFSIDNATADYCMILGCDDILMPNYIETAFKNIGNCDFYQPSVKIIDSKGKVYLPLSDKVKRLLRPKKAGIYSGETLAASLCHGNWLYFPSITWKTSTLKRYRFDPKYKVVEDVVLELDLIIDGGKLFFDTSTTFKYRRFANSVSSKEKSKGGVRFNEEAEVYKKFAKIFKDLGWKKASRAARLHVTSRIYKLIS